MTFFQFLASYATHPIFLSVILFLSPFVLEEAAILAGATLAAAGTLPVAVVLLVVTAGMIVSDWALFWAGVRAAKSTRLKEWIGAASIAHGKKLLYRGVVSAAITARLVPWLLLPIMTASGFVGVKFRRFWPVNALCAVVFVNVLFWCIYGFNLVLFSAFDSWGWQLALGLGAIVLAVNYHVARRLERRNRAGASPGDQG